MNDWTGLTPNEDQPHVLPQSAVAGTPGDNSSGSSSSGLVVPVRRLRRRLRGHASRGRATSAPPSTCGTPTGRRAATTGPSSRSRRTRPDSWRRRSCLRARRRTRPPSRSGAPPASTSATRSRSAAGPPRRPRWSPASPPNALTLGAKLAYNHGTGELVVRSGSSLVYHDMELPQDACAAGRVMRFGKSSEPALTSEGDLFATGLSSTGRLTSALHTTAFYGSPLVSWTPALGSEEYEVQWSKTAYPFKAEVVPGGSSKGMIAITTSRRAPRRSGHVVLPRARLRLLAADRRPADVVVGPGEDRRREAEVQDPPAEEEHVQDQEGQVGR